MTLKAKSISKPLVVGLTGMLVLGTGCSDPNREKEIRQKEAEVQAMKDSIAEMKAQIEAVKKAKDSLFQIEGTSLTETKTSEISGDSSKNTVE